MSNTGFFPRLIGSIVDTVRSRFWLTLLIVTFASSLLIVALTLTGDSAGAPGVDAGRMALSFAEFIALVAVLIGTPTVFIAVREGNGHGRQPFPHTLLLSLVIGMSFIVVATPAMLWAILSTSVSMEVWLPTIATVKLEAVVVAALVALSHWAIRHHGAAIATSFGLIAVLTLGPLLVLATASLAEPIKRTTAVFYIEWKDGTEPIDPETGFPVNPECQTSPTYSIEYLTDYTGVWWAIETNPIALVSASITPGIGDYVSPGYMGDGWSSEPVDAPAVPTPLDLFASVDLSVRGMQLPIEAKAVNNECENLAKYGTPYPQDVLGIDPRARVEQTRSGYTDGLIGQGLIVLVATAVLVPIRVRGRRA